MELDDQSVRVGAHSWIQVHKLTPLCLLVKIGSFAHNRTQVGLALLTPDTSMVNVAEGSVSPVACRLCGAVEGDASDRVLQHNLARPRHNRLLDEEGLDLLDTRRREHIRHHHWLQRWVIAI